MRVKKCSSSAAIFSFLYFFEVNSMHVLVHSTKVVEMGERERRERWRVDCWGPVLAKIYQEPKYVTANRVNHKNYDECLLVNLNWQLWTAAGRMRVGSEESDKGSRLCMFALVGNKNNC